MGFAPTGMRRLCTAHTQLGHWASSALETALASRILKSKTLIRSGWRRERLALLYDIGDCNLSLLVTVLAACMWRVGRHLETIARLQGAGRLTFYRQLKATFDDIGGFDSWMGMPRDCHARFYFRFHNDRHISRRRTVGLRQNLSCNPGRRGRRRALRRRIGRNEPRYRADRARRNPCKVSSCQHDEPPC